MINPDPRLTLIFHSDDFRIYLVDAFVIRSSTESEDAVDFALGGHAYRYDFIPENEIWIEPVTHQEDQEYNTGHEILERGLQKSFRMCYNKAHEKAVRFERIIRRAKVKDPIRCAIDILEILSKRKLVK